VKSLVAIAAAVVMLVVAGAAQARISTFKTPSGNIGCLYDSSPSFLRCDIRSGLLPAPPRPASCDLDWGDSVSLARRGRTKLVCHGDTALLPSAPVLAYGRIWRRGPFTCTSRRGGLTCENAADHGFFLSRGSWRRF
jgi:uncharacterized protein DUF6636